MEKAANRRTDRFETWFILICQLCLGMFLLVFTSFFLLLLIMGLPRFNWEFVAGLQSRFPDQSGVLAALSGTFGLVFLVLVMACPLGVLTAVFIQEYGEFSGNRFIRIFSRICDSLFSGMEAVPSVIYGFLGLVLFAEMMNMGRSLLAAALTLSAMAIPIIVGNCRKALQEVPQEIRESAIASGASRVQAVRINVLPFALPEIVSGTCMAMIRVAGEAAPLLVLGAVSYLTFVPDGLFLPFSALPVEIYNWTVHPGSGMHANGASAILLLLPLLLLFNSAAVFVRRKWKRKFEGNQNG